MKRRRAPSAKIYTGESTQTSALLTYLLDFYSLLPAPGAFIEATSGNSKQSFHAKFSLMIRGLKAAKQNSGPAEDLAMQALLTAVLWLSTNFDLPANFEHPTIVFAPPETIGALHYQDFLPSASAGSTNTRTIPKQFRQVVAVYNTKTRTIYLPEGSTECSPTHRARSQMS